MRCLLRIDPQRLVGSDRLFFTWAKAIREPVLSTMKCIVQILISGACRDHPGPWRHPEISRTIGGLMTVRSWMGRVQQDATTVHQIRLLQREHIMAPEPRVPRSRDAVEARPEFQRLDLALDSLPDAALIAELVKRRGTKRNGFPVMAM